MRRRNFIAVLGGVATWPLAARAQQPAMPVIGFLSSRSHDEPASVTAGFDKGLKESGYVAGQNLAIEYRWAEGQYDRLPALASDLVRRPVDVIVATGGIVSGRAAKAATTSIPIVFISTGDAVQNGLVASLNHPGGNVTGVSAINVALEAKRLELLNEFVPTTAPFAQLVNPASPETESETRELATAARVLGREMYVSQAATEQELRGVFASFRNRRTGALIVSADPFFLSRRNLIVALAAQYSVPTSYSLREYVTVGGLMSYGVNLADLYYQIGIYTGRILKGAKPADLPVLQPTKFELVINLRTAKTLGLEVPPTLLARADEVID